MGKAGGDLEARIQRLEDERDIVRTLYRYASGLDYGPREAFLDVFVENGVWMRDTPRFGPRTFNGHAELRKMWDDHTHAPTIFHKHLIGNAQVDVDGDTATATSYLFFVPEHPEGPYIRAFSRCKDKLIRCADGAWRIVERRAELEATSPKEFPPAPWGALPEKAT
jgi:ketosteroid isomerase-like protein